MATKAKERAKRAPIFITHMDLSEAMGIPTRTILRWAKSNMGGFPSPVKVVERIYVFNRKEAAEWFRLQTKDVAGGPTPD